MIPTTLSYEEVQALSLDLLSFLEHNEVPRGVAVGALLLSAMRILSPVRLEVEQEVEMAQDAIEWAVLRTMPENES